MRSPKNENAVVICSRKVSRSYVVCKTFSGASQQNSVLQNSWNRWGLVFKLTKTCNIHTARWRNPAVLNLEIPNGFEKMFFYTYTVADKLKAACGCTSSTVDQGVNKTLNTAEKPFHFIYLVCCCLGEGCFTASFWSSRNVCGFWNLTWFSSAREWEDDWVTFFGWASLEVEALLL